MERDRFGAVNVGGELAKELLGTSSVDILSNTEIKPFDKSWQFVRAYPVLAFKLHYTAGMQEVRRKLGDEMLLEGAAQNNRSINSALIQEADALLEECISFMPLTDRVDLERKIATWVNIQPPYVRDFTPFELTILDSFEDSPLVQLYKVNLPSPLT